MKTRYTALILTTSIIAASAAPQEECDEHDKSGKHPPIPRQMKKREPKPPTDDAQQDQQRDESAIPRRTIDGTGNNLQNPLWGSAHSPFLRLFDNAYADGSNEPAGADRPNAREISNAVCAQSASTPNNRQTTDFLWQWGQFLDHDIVETPTIDPAEPFNIDVPAGDPWFDPSGSGEMSIPLNRSLYEETNDVREQINVITSYIDASQVYGSDTERATALRRLDGSGKLKTTATNRGDLLPYNDAALDNAGEGPGFFLAGDVRANEQVGLTALHTLFVREHNYWAEQHLAKHPDATDEQIYQHARMIVSAEIQAITYREFLPIMLGKHALPRYDGYRDNVKADISNEFAAATFRLGHTLLSSTLQRLDENGDEIDAGHLSLAAAFFNPAATENEGISVTLRGLAAQQCQELDAMLVDDVRNFLFGAPGSGGLDLASLNIQRGRDHGLPSYAEVRKQLRLRPARNFADISPDNAQRLATVYNDVEDVDLWVGGLSERKVRGSMLGPVFHRIMIDQFTRLRDGDRFFYRHALPPELVELVEKQTLATIIRRNTTIEDEIQDNVFLTDENAVANAPTIQQAEPQTSPQNRQDRRPPPRSRR